LFAAQPSPSSENYRAISNAVLIDPVTRSGIMILSSGRDGFVERLVAEWVAGKRAT